MSDIKSTLGGIYCAKVLQMCPRLQSLDGIKLAGDAYEEKLTSFNTVVAEKEERKRSRETLFTETDSYSNDDDNSKKAKVEDTEEAAINGSTCVPEAHHFSETETKPNVPEAEPPVPQNQSNKKKSKSTGASGLVSIKTVKRKKKSLSDSIDIFKESTFTELPQWN